MSANGSSDTLTTGEAAELLRVCRQTATSGPATATSLLAHFARSPRFSAAELTASGYVPMKKPRLDPTVEAWAQTLEQVMTAAADSFSANGDVRRARMVRQVRGRLVPWLRRG